MLNYDNSENESSYNKNVELTEDEEDIEGQKGDDQNHLGKDTERSTWWMADETKNKKMNQWVQNQMFKDKVRKKKESSRKTKLRVKKLQSEVLPQVSEDIND